MSQKTIYYSSINSLSKSLIGLNTNIHACANKINEIVCSINWSQCIGIIGARFSFYTFITGTVLIGYPNFFFQTRRVFMIGVTKFLTSTDSLDSIKNLTGIIGIFWAEMKNHLQLSRLFDYQSPNICLYLTKIMPVKYMSQ